MDIFLPSFLAIVIGQFFSPALPEDMINVGDPCEKAMAVAHEQGLTLVDKEFVPDTRFRGPVLELTQLDPKPLDSLGVLTLSYDRSDSFTALLRGKKFGKGKAGFLLCALATERDPDEPEDPKK